MTGDGATRRGDCQCESRHRCGAGALAAAQGPTWGVAAGWPWAGRPWGGAAGPLADSEADARGPAGSESDLVELETTRRDGRKGGRPGPAAGRRHRAAVRWTPPRPTAGVGRAAGPGDSESGDALNGWASGVAPGRGAGWGAAGAATRERLGSGRGGGGVRGPLAVREGSGRGRLEGPPPSESSRAHSGRLGGAKSVKSRRLSRGAVPRVGASQPTPQGGFRPPGASQLGTSCPARARRAPSRHGQPAPAPRFVRSGGCPVRCHAEAVRRRQGGSWAAGPPFSAVPASSAARVRLPASPSPNDFEQPLRLHVLYREVCILSTPRRSLFLPPFLPPFCEQARHRRLPMRGQVWVRVLRCSMVTHR